MSFSLDICAGVSAPLATAARAAGISTFIPIDVAPTSRGKSHDITDPLVFDFFRACAGQAVSLWPPPRRRAPPTPSFGNCRRALGLCAPTKMEPSAILSTSERLEFDESRLAHRSVIALLNIVFTMGGHASWEISVFGRGR